MESPPHLPDKWRERLLALLDAPATKGNVGFLGAWARAEGGHAAANPLNTTYGLRGATPYNSAGVENYLDGIEGIAATALTLRLEPYGKLLAALRAGKSDCHTLAVKYASEIAVWGTNPKLVAELCNSA